VGFLFSNSQRLVDEHHRGISWQKYLLLHHGTWNIFERKTEDNRFKSTLKPKVYFNLKIRTRSWSAGFEDGETRLKYEAN
jgi:hypothetical protein